MKRVLQFDVLKSLPYSICSFGSLSESPNTLLRQWSINSVVLGCACFLAYAQAAQQPENRPQSLNMADLLSNADSNLSLPAGTFVCAPFTVPSGKTLSGQTDGTTLSPAPDSVGAFVTLTSDSGLHDLSLSGNGGPEDGVTVKRAKNVRIASVRIHDFQRNGIRVDNSLHVTIEKCELRNAETAINIIFSSNVIITENVVRDVKKHGIQFWGNWKWQKKQAQHFVVMKNQVSAGSGGGIWGSGIVDVAITHNKVEDFGDVGIDLEWCDNGTITDNDISRSGNAGIALLYSCQNVSIERNRIHQAEPAGRQSGKSALLRRGIWLSSPNTNKYPDDHGHRNIRIEDNTIERSPKSGQAIAVGRNAEVVKPEIENTINPIK